MAIETPTTPLGTPVVSAELPDVHGQRFRLDTYADGSPLLLAFVCNHCPYVQHIERELGRTTRSLQAKGLKVLAICSNDADQYPDDAPERLAQQAERAGWTFPYLVDEDQQVALRTGAVCTPDLFLYDATGRLAYRGAFDGSTPKNDVPLTGEDLTAAAEAVLAGTEVTGEQRSSMGCGIKWKPENDPN